MGKYIYRSKEAETLFNNYLMSIVNDEEISNEEQLLILENIIDLEPEIEDAAFYYNYGIAVKSSGDKDTAFSLFKKSVDCNDKHNSFEENFLVGHLVYKEIGLHYYFEKAEKSEDNKEKRDLCVSSYLSLQRSLNYYHDQEEKHHQLMEEIIRRCKSYVDSYDNGSKSKSNESQKTSSNEGCFIATAVYDGYETREVVILRRFRDNILYRNIFGRCFIKAYYIFSPTMSRFILNRIHIKRIIRVAILDKIVTFLSRKLNY